MQNDVRRTFHELYVVEIDGVKQSEHRVFIEALKRRLELKRQYPRSNVKLRDANDNASRDGAPAPKSNPADRSGKRRGTSSALCARTSPPG